MGIWNRIVFIFYTMLGLIGIGMMIGIIYII
ncbi:unnamed protein product, partial [marine sediment metagenome]